MSRALRNAACEAADRGWKIIPLRPGHKQPITRHGIKDASSDLGVVFGWWLSNPDANIGLVCNPSGLVVLDVDPRHGGDDTLAENEERWGQLPHTIETDTGGGGWHHYFRHPGGQLVGKLGAGLDVKDHGYVVLPPSLHPNGRAYEWSVDGHPDDVGVADLPSRWLAELVAIDTSRQTFAVTGDQLHPDPIRLIPASVYVPKLTGLELHRGGWVTCPFHGGGEERTPSLKVDGTLWACHACEPALGKRALGGNVYDLAGMLQGYAVPLRGADYSQVKAWLQRTLT